MPVLPDSPGIEAKEYTPSSTRPLEGVRPEVAAFALLMEKKLRENDHKGGWKDCDRPYLLRRLGQESRELQDAVLGHAPLIVGDEAADVANFAMMLADVAGALDCAPSAPGPSNDALDAARYRYLRSAVMPQPRIDCYWTKEGNPTGGLLWGEELDAALDGAMAKDAERLSGHVERGNADG